MKPDWDTLAEEAHSSVFIADVNCSDEDELCQQNEVTGYPTIKVYKDGSVEPYSGARDLKSLQDFVSTELATKCDISKPTDGCSEKAQGYITKWKAKDAAAVKKELERLQGMITKPMEKSLKAWLRERVEVLKQMSSSS